jgi:hypothetical protein
MHVVAIFRLAVVALSSVTKAAIRSYTTQCYAYSNSHTAAITSTSAVSVVDVTALYVV